MFKCMKQNEEKYIFFSSVGLSLFIVTLDAITMMQSHLEGTQPTL